MPAKGKVVSSSLIRYRRFSYDGHSDNNSASWKHNSKLYLHFFESIFKCFFFVQRSQRVFSVRISLFTLGIYKRNKIFQLLSLLNTKKQQQKKQQQKNNINIKKRKGFYLFSFLLLFFFLFVKCVHLWSVRSVVVIMMVDLWNSCTLKSYEITYYSFLNS